MFFFFCKATVVLLLRNYHIYRNGNCLSGAKLKKNTVTLHFPPFAAAVKNAKKVPSKGTFWNAPNVVAYMISVPMNFVLLLRALPKKSLEENIFYFLRIGTRHAKKTEKKDIYFTFTEQFSWVTLHGGGRRKSKERKRRMIYVLRTDTGMPHISYINKDFSYLRITRSPHSKSFQNHTFKA